MTGRVFGVESSYRRSQPLLERCDEDLDSVVAETVVASSESEGGALPVV